MTKEEVFAAVREILTSNFNIPEAKITQEAQFRGTFGLDSLDIVDFVFFLRQRFGVTDQLEDYAELNTVGKVCDYVVANGKT